MTVPLYSLCFFNFLKQPDPIRKMIGSKPGLTDGRLNTCFQETDVLGVLRLENFPARAHVGPRQFVSSKTLLAHV